MGGLEITTLEGPEFNGLLSGNIEDDQIICEVNKNSGKGGLMIAMSLIKVEDPTASKPQIMSNMTILGCPRKVVKGYRKVHARRLEEWWTEQKENLQTSLWDLAILSSWNIVAERP